MTCLEHLIENCLYNLERNKNKSSEQIIEDIKNDINFEHAGITEKQCFEICQYVFYTYLPCKIEETIDKSQCNAEELGHETKCTNYEKIKQMSVEDMAKFFLDICWDNCVCCNSTGNKECRSCKLGYQKWLESEVN